MSKARLYGQKSAYVPNRKADERRRNRKYLHTKTTDQQEKVRAGQEAAATERMLREIKDYTW